MGLATHVTLGAGGVGAGGLVGDWSGDGLGEAELSAGAGDGEGEGLGVGTVAAVFGWLQDTARIVNTTIAARFMPA